ncbi:MAG: S8 family serine peptidase, partial [Ignavibacteriaceae bacterium]|nr:S8 family serine peptidase [Ignavibacteriaceae bacterium]
MKYLTILLLIFISNLFSQQLLLFAPGQAIIKLTESAYNDFGSELLTGELQSSNAEMNRLIDAYQITKIENILKKDNFDSVEEETGLNRAFVIYFPEYTDKEIENAVNELKKSDIIEDAFPNVLGSELVNPNDPYYNSQTNLAKIKMSQAWDIQKGSPNIRIVILDTGFQPTNQEILPKIYLQKDFVDIELASYPGWTFDPNEDYVNIDDDATGLREHGTQVAQVAAATTNNAYGIAGVGWNTPLVLVRCGFQATNPQGTTVLGIEMDDIINAVNWIRTSSNAKILNISLGWTYSPSSILDAALTSCMNAGILVVASAGNSSGAPVMYPAQYPGVIAVSGTNSDDINSHYCAGSQLSVVAPANGSWVNISGSISSGAGTSLAAPLVSGAIALLLSQNPNLTPALVKKIIEVTAVKVPGMNGQNFHNYYGYGLLDVYEALRATNSIYTFTNKVMSSGYGSLIIDNDKVNPVPTGSKVPFKYGTLHQSRTNELPFLVNYSGTTQKFNMWYGNSLTPDYNLQLSFTADNLTPAEKDANFIATAPVTIKNIFPEVGALNPANDNISFKDPWYFNKDNNNNWFQTNQYYQYPSPLEIQNNSSSSYGGVFLDQPYTGNNPIYYSVQAISPQDIALSQTGKTHRFYFRNWSGTSVNFQNENNPSTGVVFNYDNAEVNANFKG